MPTSVFMGREFFTHHLSRVAENLTTVVDFGPGEGTYSILGRHLAPNAEWKCLEIFEPYVERYDLIQKYDQVYVGDLRKTRINPFSLGIFGDVLEHLPWIDARDVLKYFSQMTRYLYVSVPIIPAPQGESHGNQHEAHLYDWTFEEMTETLLDLNPVKWDAVRGPVVGRWWLDMH